MEVLAGWNEDWKLIDKEGKAIKGARLIEDDKGVVKVVLSS